MIDLEKINNIYCAGIGGIGLSAVVRFLVSHGKKVSGSDTAKSEVTELLEELGVFITYDQKDSHIPEGPELVFYSKALDDTNPELVFAREHNIPLLTYPEMLGVISKGKKTIQVTGTHGKTTTTAMTARAVESLDPSVIVGSLIDHSGGKTNYIEGKSDYLVLESCEYKRSFEHIQPFVLVITNIEEDHLDYYKDLTDIQSAFRDVAQKVPSSGAVVCDPNDPKVIPVIEGLGVTIIDYTKINVSDIDLRVPGQHNIRNAQCARAVADFLSVNSNYSKKGLESFSGTWRRFEYKGEMENGALVYDDYGHHPTEVRVTLEGFRQKFPDKKILLAFHPHLYSRTKQFFSDFALELSKVDMVVVAPVFRARSEVIDPAIDSKALAKEISHRGTDAVALDSFKEIEDFLREKSDSETIIVTMGAGDIYKVSDSLVAPKE